MSKKVEQYNEGDIINSGYIADLDDLRNFLDENGNFETKGDFEWWNRLADSLEYLENDIGLELTHIVVDEVGDYITIADEYREKTL